MDIHSDTLQHSIKLISVFAQERIDELEAELTALDFNDCPYKYIGKLWEMSAYLESWRFAVEELQGIIPRVSA